MPQAGTARVTMLSSMAGKELDLAMDRHVELGVELLDLKDALFGKRVMDLTDEQASRAAEMASRRGLRVHCMSTHLFGGDVEDGEQEFQASHLTRVDRAIELAGILQPHFIRLLAAASPRRWMYADCAELLRAEHPWLIGMYGQAVDRIHAAGFRTTIENEVGECVIRTAGDVVAFFGELARPEKVSFTWDVQNLWQMGTFPDAAVYEEIAGLVGYLHLKGGRHREDDPRRELAWRSSLAEASWPVVEIARRVIADGRCGVICLNPSHGRPVKEGVWEDFVVRDLDFLRSHIREIA